jgi:HicA toxin of bacterial toxin-antitoxin,
MNRKNKKTLEQIFKKPTQSNIEWKAIENLLIALGAEISEGSGSRVRIFLNGWRGVYHRPHPRKETVRGAVEQLRKDLIKIGIRP